MQSQAAGNNFDLRPPLPPNDYPYPRCSHSHAHASYDGDGVSAGGKGQCPASSPLQEDGDDGNFAALPPKAKLILRSMLCRMYASAEVMQLGSETRFTSLVLFHRYYLASNLIGTLSREEATATDRKDGSRTHVAVSEKWREHLGTVAASCLFLGCKVEEEHRRIRDVINLSHMFDFAGDRGDAGIEKSTQTNGESINDDQQHPAATANDDIIHIHEANSPPDLDDDYWKAKERIAATEQEVLRMLHFDVSVGHPHRAVLLILDGLGIDVTTNEGRALANKSFMALNDALFYPPALRHGVLPMACGAIRLAAGNGETKDDSKSSGGGGVGAPPADVSSSSAFLPPGAWWRRFDVSDADIELDIKSLERARTSIRSI